MARSLVPRSPKTIAAVYGLVSLAWIAVSDWAVRSLLDDPARITQAQTAKGWLFVAGSALLVYGLVRHGQRDLERANARLDRALRQSSILQRLLRHNLRNSCNVISGNVELIEEEAEEPPTEPIRTIRGQTNHLVQLGEKTGLLRTILVEESAKSQEVDLAAAAESVAERARVRYPDAEIRTDLPQRLRTETHPHVETALEELVENAIVHDDDPRVTLSIETDEEWVSIDVRDTGPGLPTVERETLRNGVETPMVHSEGLGLWIAHAVVTRAGGRLDIEPNEPRGTVVTIRLPA